MSTITLSLYTMLIEKIVFDNMFKRRIEKNILKIIGKLFLILSYILALPYFSNTLILYVLEYFYNNL